jgi:hypothetical protein
MAKFKPGIPDNFKFNVKPVTDLGDYLDEPRPSPRPQKPKEESVGSAALALEPIEVEEGFFVETPLHVVALETTPVTTPQVIEEDVVALKPPASNIDIRPIQTQATSSLVAEVKQSETAAVEIRKPIPKPPRREFNLSTEALSMIDELLEMIQSGSGQKDASASELMQALVVLAYEAKNELNPYSIPKRGRWGSPTARAFPVEIRNAVLKAILEKNRT